MLKFRQGEIRITQSVLSMIKYKMYEVKAMFAILLHFRLPHSGSMIRT